VKKLGFVGFCDIKPLDQIGYDFSEKAGKIIYKACSVKMALLVKKKAVVFEIQNLSIKLAKLRREHEG
jgi:hypothetical protein